jgi:hypothetical protein
MQTTICAVAIKAPISARLSSAAPRSAGFVRPNLGRRVCFSSPISALPGTNSLPSVPGDKDDLPGYLAVAGLAVTELSKSKFAMTPELLYASLAVYNLVYVVLSVVNGKFEADRVGNVIAPTFLASAALGFFNGHISAFDCSTAGFGYFLAQALPGPLPLWLATLAYAIYSNHAAEWAVAAFGLSAAYKIFNAVNSKSFPAPQNVLFLALAGWAFYTNAAHQVALLIYGGHVLSSTVN